MQGSRTRLQLVEKQFHELVEQEINKANTFYLKTHARILGKIDSLRAVLVGTALGTPESSGGRKKTDDLRNALLGQISHIDSQLNSLWAFCWSNHLAVWKIVKKHDKFTGLVATPWCMNIAEQKEFFKNSERFGLALVRFSECCAKVRNILTGRNENDDARPVSTAGSQSFTRQTVKYWVETRDLMKVKTVIAKHLPLYLFDPKKASRDWALISSVYYDDPATMQLYEGRLKKLEGAIAVRMRTYEGSEHEVFVERKTHHENWAWGENSVKERFSLDQDDVFDFTIGKYNETDFRARIAARGLSGPAADKALQLFRQVDSQFKTFQLAPTMTTEYKRTAFQIPGNASVRVSLDTDLTFIRESMSLNPAEGRWKKAKNEIQPSDVHVFPYAILEVKIETAEGAEPPQWIIDLTNSPLVRVVHQFSKYIHGCARLLPDKVNCFPQWIDWPDLLLYVQNPTVPLSLPYERELKPSPKGSSSSFSSSSSHWSHYLQPSLPGPPSDSDLPDDGHFHASSSSSSGGEMQLLSVVSETPRRRHQARGSAGPKVSSAIRPSENDEDTRRGCSSCLSCLSTADRKYNGRPIIPRVKIEPKTYFANERTFLRWMSLCIMLEGIGIALLSIPNFSGSSGSMAGVSGCIFVVVSIIFMGYALYMHRWRARAIAAQSSTRFDDMWGPVALFFTIVAAALVNMIIYLSNFTPSSHT
ncbi:MAG: VTC domain-containing protein [archaeon]|nr:VTC domain-containing protein [archaeon]